MEQIYLYNVPGETREFFGTNTLMSVATRFMNFPGGNFMDTNIYPGQALFNGKGFAKTDGGWYLMEGALPVAFIESGEGQGCEYRWYNNANKAKATMCRLLVHGDPTRDLICANPGIQIEQLPGGITMVKNITTVNGQPWQEVHNNRTIKLKGFHFAVTNVVDGIYGGVRYLSSTGYDQHGSSRKEYQKLSKYQKAITVDIKGTSQMNDESVDYVYSIADQADANVEYLGLAYVYAVKNESEWLRVPLQKILG